MTQPVGDYPNTYVQFAPKVDRIDVVLAEHVNKLQREVEGLEFFIGLKGDFPPVGGSSANTSIAQMFSSLIAIAENAERVANTAATQLHRLENVTLPMTYATKADTFTKAESRMDAQIRANAAQDAAVTEAKRLDTALRNELKGDVTNVQTWYNAVLTTIDNRLKSVESAVGGPSGARGPQLLVEKRTATCTVLKNINFGVQTVEATRFKYPLTSGYQIIQVNNVRTGRSNEPPVFAVGHYCLLRGNGLEVHFGINMTKHETAFVDYTIYNYYWG